MAAGRSLMFTGLSLSQVVPSLVMETTGISLAFSLTGRTLGTSTSMPNSITCAVNMKMINSTSTTSTKGVTLISESVDMPPRLRDPNPPPPPFTDNAIRSLPAERALGHVQELQRKVFHAGADFTNRMAEVVVEDGGRYGGEQAESRGDEGFRDAGPKRLQAGAAHVAQILEGPDNAQHRAEQSDKWSDRGRSCQPVHVSFQLGGLLADAQLQAAFERRAAGHLAARLDLTLQFFITEIENRHQRRGPVAFAGRHQGLQRRGLAEGPQKTGIGLPGSADGVPLGENDGPGEDRKEQQEAQDRPTHGPGVLHHFPGINLKKEGKGSVTGQLVS